MKTFIYKNYAGSIDFDLDGNVLRGKLLCIDDLVTYEAADLPTLRVEFESAVDDYLETCKTVGKRPQKPYNGVFNVRTGAELHKKAILRSLQDETTLNAVVVAALQAYVAPEAAMVHTHMHDHKFTVVAADPLFSLSSVSAGQPMREVAFSTEGSTHVH